MIIQIYSMTSIPDAIATAEAGADLVGVVVAEPGVVAEGIEAAEARDILAAVRPRARGVALSLADDCDEICAMVDAVRPDIVHIAAREIASREALDDFLGRARGEAGVTRVILIAGDVVGAKGPSSGHTILILGATSSGAAAKQSYAMKVKMAGGTAQVSRQCRVF